MKIIGFTVFIISLLLLSSDADPVADKIALLDFINNIRHSRPLNWYTTPFVCTQWTGVTCSYDHSRVTALRLPGLGLTGPIPPNTLSRLTAIQTLSLRSNAITGPFPVELAMFDNLTALYLQSNKFTGDLPFDFFASKNVSVIDFSYNKFTGSIPLSVSNLTQLAVLNLAHNNLSGKVPDLWSPSLQVLNLSYNNLTGPLPQSLKKFPLSAFIGNNIVYDFDSPSPFSPAMPPITVSPTRSGKKRRILLEHVLLGVILGCVILLFAVIAFFMIFRRSKRGYDDASLSVNPNKKNGPAKNGVSGSRNKNNKLIFFEGCNLAFDLEDLLRASAEVLGKGAFGTTYKAALEDTSTIVVKRLKDTSVAKREFEQQMELVGNIRHENVASLRAYYYSKEEKLMIYDYFFTGSVSALLHGKRPDTDGAEGLDWEARLRVAVGAARGISHIHGVKLVHGNIKSSNVFINADGYGCVSDLGLATLMNPTLSSRATGFQAPEVTDTRKATQASDVYSYGVLLLELLTGKSAVSSLCGNNEVVHLVRWVNSVVREEWTAEVFDVELFRYPNIEEEMVELLQVGLCCTVRMADERPKMVEVVKMVEDIRRMSTRPSSAGIKSEHSTPFTQKQVERGSSSSAAK